MLNTQAPLFDLTPSLQKEVVKVFMEECTEEMNYIDNFVAQRKWHEVRNKAHKLKGSSSMIGASEFSQTVGKIERDFDRNSSIDHSDLVKLSQLHSELMDFLKQFSLSL